MTSGREFDFIKRGRFNELQKGVSEFQYVIRLVEFFAGSFAGQNQQKFDSHCVPVLEPHLHAEIFGPDAILNYRPPVVKPAVEAPVLEALPVSPDVPETSSFLNAALIEPEEPPLPPPRFPLGSPELLDLISSAPLGITDQEMEDMNELLRGISKKKQEQVFALARKTLASFVQHTTSFMTALRAGVFNGHVNPPGMSALDLHDFSQRLKTLTGSFLTISKGVNEAAEPDPAALWKKLHDPVRDWCLGISGLAAGKIKDWLKSRANADELTQENILSILQCSEISLPLSSREFLVALQTIFASFANTDASDLLTRTFHSTLTEDEKLQIDAFMSAHATAHQYEKELLELLLDDPEDFETELGGLMDELLAMLNAENPLACTHRNRDDIRPMVRAFYETMLSAIPSSLPEPSSSVPIHSALPEDSSPVSNETPGPPETQENELLKDLRAATDLQEVMRLMREIAAQVLSPEDLDRAAHIMKDHFRRFAVKPPAP